MKRSESLAEILTGDLPSVIADFQGIIVDVNEHFEIFTGWKKQEIVGQLISVILPSYFRESHHMGFSRFTASGVATIGIYTFSNTGTAIDSRENGNRSGCSR